MDESICALARLGDGCPCSAGDGASYLRSVLEDASDGRREKPPHLDTGMRGDTVIGTGTDRGARESSVEELALGQSGCCRDEPMWW